MKSGLFLLVVLAVLGIALPAVAQTADPPRFLLESIVVEGVQRDAVREIVAAESLLQPGREYSEQELREAVYRVKRLPFVMDAEFSLRKGGERGSYQLVITVEETRLLFYSVDVFGSYFRDDPFRQHEHASWDAGATAGGRWFVGSQGMVFGSVQGVDGAGATAAQAGYTRYNLFGRGGFASLVLGTDVGDNDDRLDVHQGSFTLGVPIVGNHSLRADVDWTRSDENFLGTRFRNDQKSVGLSWIYDTTDDPLFPTSGTRLSGGGNISRLEQEVSDRLFRSELSQDSYVVDFGGSRYWALTHRQSISATLGSSYFWTEPVGDLGIRRVYQWSSVAAVGHSFDLLGFAKAERFGDLRWENDLQVARTQLGGGFLGRSEDSQLALGTGLVYRNAWGVVRASFAVIEILEDGR